MGFANTENAKRFRSKNKSRTFDSNNFSAIEVSDRLSSGKEDIVTIHSMILKMTEESLYSGYFPLRLQEEFFYAMDAESQELMEIAYAAVDSGIFEDAFTNGNLAIINIFKVHQRYRGNGIGANFMEKHIAYLRRYYLVSCLMLMPGNILKRGPFQDEKGSSFVHSQRKLSHYYKNRLGFRKVGRYKIMVKWI